MGLVDHADPEQRPGDRDLGLLGEGAQLVPGPGVQDAVPGQDDRPFGGGDLGRGQLELAAVPVDVGPEAGQSGDDLVLGRVLGLRLLLEGVLGDVDVDRARAARPGDVERLRDHPRQVVRVADQVVVLGHRQGDAVDVDLLEGVLADQGARHVAGDRDHRHRIEERRPDPRHQVGRARPRRPHADPDPAGHPRVAVRRVRPALLVADEHVAELRVVPEHVVERQDHPARVAEEDVDALAQERLAQHVGPDAGPPELAALVEHLLAGALDGRRLGRPVVGHVAAPLRRGRGQAEGTWRVGRVSLGHGHGARGPPWRVVRGGRPGGKRKTLAVRRGSVGNPLWSS